MKWNKRAQVHQHTHTHNEPKPQNVQVKKENQRIIQLNEIQNDIY